MEKKLLSSEKENDFHFLVLVLQMLQASLISFSF